MKNVKEEHEKMAKLIGKGIEFRLKKNRAIAGIVEDYLAQGYSIPKALDKSVDKAVISIVNTLRDFF